MMIFADRGPILSIVVGPRSQRGDIWWEIYLGYVFNWGDYLQSSASYHLSCIP